MHHAREQTYILSLDRDDIPSVAHGHNGVLKVCFCRGRADHLLQTRLDQVVLVAHVTPDRLQHRRRVVRHLIFADNGVVDIMLQLYLRVEKACYLGYDFQAFRHVFPEESLYGP